MFKKINKNSRAQSKYSSYNLFVSPLHWSVINTVYSVLSEFCWQNSTGILLDSNPWPLHSRPDVLINRQPSLPQGVSQNRACSMPKGTFPYAYAHNPVDCKIVLLDHDVVPNYGNNLTWRNMRMDLLEHSGIATDWSKYTHWNVNWPI